MNKRADLSILILTLIVLLLCSTTIFAFGLHKKKITAEIIDGKEILRVYEVEEKFNFLLNELVKDGVVKYYSESFEKTSNARDAESFFNSKVFLISVDYSTKGSLIVSDFENGISKIGNGSKSQVDGINVNLNGDVISLTGGMRQISATLYREDGKNIWKWNQVGNEDNRIISILYRPESNQKLNITEIGLHGFDYIYGSIEECKKKMNKSEIKKCLSEKLYNFDVTLQEAEKDFIIMNTKGNFFLNGKNQKIMLKTELTQGL